MLLSKIIPSNFSLIIAKPKEHDYNGLSKTKVTIVNDTELRYFNFESFTLKKVGKFVVR